MGGLRYCDDFEREAPLNLCEAHVSTEVVWVVTIGRTYTFVALVSDIRYHCKNLRKIIHDSDFFE